jgi:hypothetical protein
MQQYITDNNLPNKSSDTSTTGDIYDYVVEGLSAGATTVVIVELTTASPANAELRRYSLVTGWANFEVDASNTIHTKTSATCADNSTWKTGLTTGATCLRLTIKDGGANDTDGYQTDTTSKLAQPVTNEYLRNSAFAGIAVVSSTITTVVAPALKPSTT